MNQKTRILFAFSISLLILVLVGAFSLMSINKYRESSKWVHHTQTVISETQEILAHCQDIETANRGYAITGDKEYLDPFHHALKVIRPTARNLKTLTKNNPQQQVLLDSLEKLVNAKIDFAKLIHEVCEQHGTAAAQKLITTDTGEILMDKIRNTVDKLIKKEEKLLSVRLSRTEESFSSTISFIASSVILSVFIIFLSIMLFVRDYNKRLKIEKALSEGESRLRQFLDALPVGVFIMDEHYKPYYANSKAKEILGSGIIPQSDKSMAEIYHAYEKGTDHFYPDEKSPILRVLKGEPNVSTEDLEIQRDNIRIPLRINASPVKNSENEIEYAISVFEDITDQQNTQLQLIRAKQLAEESSLLKEIFLANMSHEIRTPMNAIIGFASLMKETKMDDEQKDYIANISTASENLLGIINDILDISKIEAGHIVIEEIPFNLRKTVRNSVVILQQKAKEAGLELSFHVDKDIPENLMGDPTRLNQVLLNLTNNAIKFTQQGAVKILVLPESHSDTEMKIRFTVQDTGIGIPPEKLESIFERFAQADPNTTRIYGGTGLGLSICKSLVELQGGTIYVESAPNEGSAFHFILTFKKFIPIEKPAMKKAVGQQDNTQEIRILLVEDNLLNQKLAMKVLENFGFSAELAENGKIAVDKISQQTYDVILMDLQMPEMDGYRATEFIRNELEDATPIIAMTAHSLIGEKDKCMSIGMNDYIPKPFSPGILHEKIIALIPRLNEAGESPENS